MAPPRLAFFPDDWAKYPKLLNDDGTHAEGPRSIKLIIDATATAQEVDLKAFVQEQILSNIQSVKIDNSENADAVTIISRLTGDRLTIPGEAMGFLPWQFTANDQAFSIQLASGSGTVCVWLYNTPKPLGVWYTQGAGNVVTISGTVTVAEVRAAAAARTSVAASAADVQLLASNVNRKGGSIFNDSASATLYVALGATAASTASYTAQVLPGGLYELPKNYTGEVRGIWSAAVGNARVTELT